MSATGQPNQSAASSFETDHAQRPILPTQPEISYKDSAVYYQFQYKPERDSATEVRSALLVVMTLVAAATFQAGINPPGGVYQETFTVDGVTRHAGNAILSSKPGNCKLFFFCNTVAFSTSMSVISFLVYRFPFYREIWVSLLSFTATYGASIGYLNPGGASASCAVYAIVAFFVPPVLTLVLYLVNLVKMPWRRGTR